MPRPPGTPRKLTAFRLSAEEMRKLETLAAEQEKNKSEIVRELINRKYNATKR